MSGGGRTLFVTGFPGSLARRVIPMLAAEGDARVKVLAGPDDTGAARELFDELENVSVVEGSIGQIDFGLSGADFLALADEVTAVLHLPLQAPPGARESTSRARDGMREVIELGRAARDIEHLVVLSSLDVAGDAAGIFAERDLDLGQGFAAAAALDRFRAERVARRFRDELPITVLRPGWLVGDEPDLTPLVIMLATVDDPDSLSEKEAGRTLYSAPIEMVARVCASLGLGAPDDDVRTLHLVFSELPPVAEQVRRVLSLTSSMAPVGFEVAVGARRALRRSGSPHAWSAREFFKKQGPRARVTTALTERFLARRGISVPTLDDQALAALAGPAVERIVRFR